MALSQSWLYTRFEGLTAQDFEERVYFSSAAHLLPPPNLTSKWHKIAGMAAAAQNDNVFVVVFCDVSDPEQHLSLQRFLNAVSMAETGFPVVAAHHSVAPEHRTVDEARDAGQVVATLMRMGATDVLITQPQGLQLDLVIRGKMQQCEWENESLEKLDMASKERRQAEAEIKSRIKEVVWDYCCPRMVRSLPPVDPNLRAGSMPQIPGFRTGIVLGTGACGVVYNIQPEGSQGDTTSLQCVKAMEKKHVNGIIELSRIKKMLSTMRHLSSTQFHHPSVARMYEVYHTPTHILIRMQYGGRRNLFNILRRREQAQDAESVLPGSEFRSMLLQAGAGIAYLHSVAGVVHRDIKPENYICNFEQGKLAILLADFDCALVVERTSKFHRVCGTQPFVAPEACMEETFNLFPTDIWSLGVLILEMVCGTRVMERHLDLQGLESDMDAMARVIFEYFSEPGSAVRILQRSILHELRHLLPALESVVDGTLKVDPTQRNVAAQVAEALELLPHTLG